MDRWSSDAFADQEIGKKVWRDIKGNLRYSYHPLYDWRPLPNQRLETIEINEYGLRSREISLQDNKIRCLLIGGSFPWGYGASSNKFIPSYLIEDILKENNINVSIINLADQLYDSVQNVKSIIFSVNDLNPEVLLCVIGHNDIGRGFRGTYQSNVKYFEFMQFFDWGIRTGLINESSYLKKVLKVFVRGYKKFKQPEKEYFSFNCPGREDIPSKLLQNLMDNVNAICIYKKIKVVYVLQPFLYLKRNHSDYEKRFIAFRGSERHKYFMSQLGILKDKFWNDEQGKYSNVYYIDSTNFFDEYNESIFIDCAHLTDKGFRIWSKKVCERLIDFKIFKQPSL